MRKIDSKAGYTLIEIMIALTLGFFIISIMLSIYIRQQTLLTKVTNQTVILQEAQKIAVSLRDLVSQAGYIGCAKLTADFPISSNSSDTLNVYNRLRGEDQSLTIKMMSTHTNVIHPQDVLLFSTCQKVEIRRADAPVTVEGGDVEMGKLNTYQLYYKNHEMILLTNHTNPLVLAKNVMQLHLLYAMQGSSFMKAKNISNWSRVINVAFYFTLKKNNQEMHFYGVTGL